MNILVRGPCGRTLLQMRDELAPVAPLLWGFWGGAVEATDPDPYHAAVREIREELSVETAPDDYLIVSERRGSDGRTAPLLLLQRRLAWCDIAIAEGAGGAFLRRSGMRTLPVTRAVAWHLEHDPELFLEPEPEPGTRAACVASPA